MLLHQLRDALLRGVTLPLRDCQAVRQFPCDCRLAAVPKKTAAPRRGDEREEVGESVGMPNISEGVWGLQLGDKLAMGCLSAWRW